MLLGALLDIGLSFEELEETLQTLPLSGYRIHWRKEGRNHIHGTRFLVEIEEEVQKRRGLKEICEIIEAGRLSSRVKEKSIEIFRSLARVEGEIHSRPPEEIHFHEVGAVDSIIDIVGSVFAVESLKISAIDSSPVPLGGGFVETRHGRLPIPAPAAIALLKGVPVYDSGLKYEMITPTGAALLKGMVRSCGALPPMRVDRVGYGVGSRELPDRPNLLRIILGQDRWEEPSETVVILEANLDDSHPEWVGFLMERLFVEGALDVLFMPVQMKKNRPGILVQVLAEPRHEDRLMDILFQESSTLGVRFRHSQRKILKRAHAEIDSPWGSMRVKKVWRPDGSTYFSPEYEVCRQLAEANNRPLKEIYSWVMSRNHFTP
jgi:uncharacterized protein (TIGR00299 family) protein